MVAVALVAAMSAGMADVAGGWAGVWAAAPVGPFSPPAKTVATINVPALREISGCAVSTQAPGGARIVWVHNDSGDGPNLYALDGRSGKLWAAYTVSGAAALDWEDMALANGQLYGGDIGDNDATRSSIVVYRMAEAKIALRPAAAGSAKRPISRAVALELTYPDGSHNAEAMAVHPRTGDLYIITKAPDGHAGVYALRAAATAPAGRYRLEKVSELSITNESMFYPNLITGAAIAPTGDRIVLRTYQYLYVYRPSVAESGGQGGFDSAWSARPSQLNVPFLVQAEAVCFTPDGRSVLTTHEGRPARLVEVDLRRN